MNEYPKYEVWGQCYDNGYYDAYDEFLENCFTLEEAEKAVKEYSDNGSYYAYWKLKDQSNDKR